MIPSVIIFAVSPKMWQYHNYDEMVKYLKDHEEHFPALVKTTEVGKSKEGKVIYSVEITSEIGEKGKIKPNIGFIGSLHGYDVVGQEILLMFIHHLTKRFNENDERITELLKSVRIHLIPNGNVDGLSRAEKGDCNGMLYSGEDFYNQFTSGKDYPDDIEVPLSICIKCINE